MTQVNVYINFDGNCREAMEFYKACLGGDLMLQTVAESPVARQCPTSMQEQIMHSSLSKDALLIMGSDMVIPDKYWKGNMIALALNCNNEEEINSIFSKLSVDGEINSPLRAEFWGAMFGELTDKFGIRWMLNYDKNQK